ncbi:hypothetical protein BST61_g5459 [Cercospora zeina]
MPRKASQKKAPLPLRTQPFRKTKLHATKGDAAVRAFNTPELLEQILLFAVSEQIPHSENTTLKILKFSPMPGSARTSCGGVCLFRLQSVNRAFRDAILGSPKLKRLIWLAPYDNKRLKELAAAKRGGLPYHTPLYGLLEELEGDSWRLFCDGDFRDRQSAQTDSATGAVTLTIKVLADSEKFGTSLLKRWWREMPRAWWNTEASLKKIKLCNAREAVDLTVNIKNGGRGWRAAFPPNEYFEVSWNFPADATLGDFFRLFSELLLRVEDRTATKKAISDKWASVYREERKMDFSTHLALEEKSHRAEEVAAAMGEWSAQLEEWKAIVEQEQDAKIKAKAVEKE